MKEVCGFEGKDGRLYKTQEECEKADVEYKVQGIRRQLNNFSNTLGSRLFREKTIFKRHAWFEEHKDYFLGLVATHVLKNSDKFIEIINQKKELEKELDYLESKTNNKPWWLKVKWWK